MGAGHVATAGLDQPAAWLQHVITVWQLCINYTATTIPSVTVTEHWEALYTIC